MISHDDHVIDQTAPDSLATPKNQYRENGFHKVAQGSIRLRLAHVLRPQEGTPKSGRRALGSYARIRAHNL